VLDDADVAAAEEMILAAGLAGKTPGQIGKIAVRAVGHRRSGRGPPPPGAGGEGRCPGPVLARAHREQRAGRLRAAHRRRAAGQRQRESARR
jgi:hypothetical protein